MSVFSVLFGAWEVVEKILILYISSGIKLLFHDETKTETVQNLTMFKIEEISINY